MRRIAAIDIGSNSIRGIVAEVAPDGTYRIIDDERFQTRLAAGLAATGRIAADRADASVTALEHLLRVARARGADTVRALATAAVRTAANGPEFLASVHDRLGLAIEVIDGPTEARLAFLSAEANFDLPDPVGVLDIGGGSLELVIARHGAITDVHSFPLGAVRLLADLPADEDPPSADALDALAAAVSAELSAGLGEEPPGVHTVIGSGGTVTSLVGVAVAARGEDPFSLQGAEVSAGDLERTWEQLATLPRKRRARTPGLAAYRADTVVPGGLVVREVMRQLGAERLIANQKGLREGILLDTIATLGRDATPPPLREVAERFGERCHYDAEHAAHVTRHALALFDALREFRLLPAAAGARERELLEAAAVTHDVGYLIGHDKHHRHSWNLIAHADLPGLTARETTVVAAVARYHRGAHPKRSHEAWRRVSDEDRALVRVLAGILRVADGLDRSQVGRVHALSLAEHDGALVVVAEGPGDLDVEIRGAAAKAALLAEALDRPVEITDRCPPRTGRVPSGVRARGTGRTRA